MKTLHLILCALATATVTQAQRGVQPRDVEIIVLPGSPNLFARPSTNIPSGRPITDGRAIIVGPSANRFTSSAVVGRSPNLNVRPLVNNAGGRMGELIGPVFPARTLAIPAQGRAIGIGGVIVGAGAGIGTNGFGTNDVGFIEDPLTNALPTGFGTGETGVGQLPVNTVPGSAVPSPAVTAPLTPPTPVAPPAPTGSGAGRTIPGAVPSVPGSAVPAPPPGAPLAPPTGPALPPTAPPAPAPAPAPARR
jgi:hypothetical protein